MLVVDNKIVKKERNVGLDILRIVIMFLITARHYLGYSGVVGSGMIEYDSLLSRFAYAIIVLGQCAPNIFILISGYFLVNSRFKVNRILKIWAITWLYSVTFFLFGMLINRDGFSFSSVIFSVLPVASRHYWFVVAYIALIAVSPFLNKMIKSITFKEHTAIVTGGALILSVWTSVFYYSQGVVTGGNTGLLWCIYLYLVGAYINIYKDKIKSRMIVCIILVVSFLAEYVLFRLTVRIPFLKNFSITDDDSIFNLILSVSIFILFLNFDIRNKKIVKLITAISTSSFGIYLIQEHCMIREYLWFDLVNANRYKSGWWMFGILILCFIVLIILSYLCEKIFNVIYSKFYSVVEKIITRVMKK